MKIEFDTNELNFPQARSALLALLNAYDTKPIADLGPNITSVYTQNPYSTLVGATVSGSPVELWQNVSSEAFADLTKAGVEATAEAKPTHRGRPKKEPTKMSAAELMKELAPTPVEVIVEAAKTPVEPEKDPLPVEAIVAAAQEEPSTSVFDLMDMSAPYVAPVVSEPAPGSHDDLVNRVRALMFIKGHVWMTNVLAANKKKSATLAEMPDDILLEVLTNPDKYDALV